MKKLEDRFYQHGFDWKYLGVHPWAVEEASERVAWSLTFEKWATLIKLGGGVGDGRSSTCGLCRLYSSARCYGCPIADAGHKGCVGTPYEPYQKSRSVADAERELAFLLQVFAIESYDIYDSFSAIGDGEGGHFLIFDGLYPVRGDYLHGWAITFAKWARLATVNAGIADRGDLTCGLCMASPSGCAGCPVAAAVFKQCEGTPYKAYKADPTPDNAWAEFKFLLAVYDGRIGG